MSRQINPEPYTVYSFAELSEDAQNAAIEAEQECRYNEGNPWSDEWNASRAAFLRHYGLARCRTNRDGESIYPDSDSIAYAEEADVPLTGHSLAEVLRDESPEQGTCSWTGYCGDEAFLDGVYAFIAAPDGRNRAEVLADAYAEGIRQWKADDEYYYSKEAAREYLGDDDREYHENGTVY